MAELTAGQREFLDRAVAKIASSDTGAGEITITIRNHHVRSLTIHEITYFPKPDEVIYPTADQSPVRFIRE